MAEKQAPPTAKLVRCKVVSNYGGKFPGMMIEVDQAEYNRLREVIHDAEGRPRGHRFPVLVTEGDEAAAVRAEAAEREAAMKRQIEETDHGAGWAEMEKKSLGILQGQYAARAQAQQEEMKRLAALAPQ